MPTCSAPPRKGIKGKRAVDWRLVDEVVPGSKLEETVAKRARRNSPRSRNVPPGPRGSRSSHSSASAPQTPSSTARCQWNSSARERLATISCAGRMSPPPASADAMVEQGAEFWPLRLARELDDAILDIRANELDVAAIVFTSSGDPAQVLAYDRFLDANNKHWLVREIRGPVEAGAQARRSHLALARGSGRARLVLCRDAGRTGVREPTAPTC